MAKIENAKTKTVSGGYVRLFNDKELGLIFSKVQSTVITNGTELEKIILSKTNQITNLNKFIDDTTNGITPNGIYTCNKSNLRNSDYHLKGHEPDFLIFIVQAKRICKIIELKDGDNFDTKKSPSEKNSLIAFQNFIAPKIPFLVEYYICSFNQNDKTQIQKGFKNCFTLNEILTGQELCDVLKLNYNDIVNERLKDAESNLEYVIKELLKNDKVKNIIKKNNLLD